MRPSNLALVSTDQLQNCRDIHILKGLSACRQIRNDKGDIRTLYKIEIMDRNQPNNHEATPPEGLDDELENVNRQNEGFTGLDDEEENEEEKGGKDGNEKDDEEEEEEEKGTEEKDDEEDEEEKSEDEEEEKEDDGEKKDKPQKKDDEKDDEEDEEGKSPDRPVRYVPVKKHQAVKAKLKQERDEAVKAAEDLKKEVEGITTEHKEGSKGYKDALKDYAKKRGFKEDDVAELADIIVKASQGGVMSEDDRKFMADMKLEKQRKAEEQYFDSEFDTEVAPLIKEKFPDISKENAGRIKARIDELSHTEKLHKTPLSYIFNNHSSELEALASGKGVVEKGGKRTVESGRPGTGRERPSMSAKEFSGKDAKELDPMFKQLSQLDEKEKQKIIKDMDPDSYSRYISWYEEASEEEGMEVNRGGRTIRLK